MNKYQNPECDQNLSSSPHSKDKLQDSPSQSHHSLIR